MNSRTTQRNHVLKKKQFDQHRTGEVGHFYHQKGQEKVCQLVPLLDHMLRWCLLNPHCVQGQVFLYTNQPVGGCSSTGHMPCAHPLAYPWLVSLSSVLTSLTEQVSEVWGHCF